MRLQDAAAWIFDMDDTLIGWSQAEKLALDAAFETHLSPAGVATAHAWQRFDDVLAENFAAFHRTGRWWYARDRLARLAQLLEVDAGLVDPMERTFRDTVQDHLALLDGSVETLGLLRDRGRRTGILTNGPADVQRRKIDALRLSEHVDHVAVSGETGHWKPDAAAFQGVLEALGTDPADTVMVGDHPDFDIRPAKALGMTTVWVHGDGGTCHEADHVVPNPAAIGHLLA